MKPDYLIPGMPTEVERIKQIWEHYGRTNLTVARGLFDDETDCVAIQENDIRSRAITEASVDLLEALEVAIKYIPHCNKKALWMAKNAINKAYNG